MTKMTIYLLLAFDSNWTIEMGSSILTQNTELQVIKRKLFETPEAVFLAVLFFFLYQGTIEFSNLIGQIVLYNNIV